MAATGGAGTHGEKINNYSYGSWCRAVVLVECALGSHRGCGQAGRAGDRLKAVVRGITRERVAPEVAVDPRERNPPPSLSSHTRIGRGNPRHLLGRTQEPMVSVATSFAGVHWRQAP